MADKVNREIKQTETTLTEVEYRIEDEARRVERLHPMDAKKNCDAIDSELAQCEDTIRSLSSDIKVLKDLKHHEASTLHKRYLNFMTCSNLVFHFFILELIIQKCYTILGNVRKTEILYWFNLKNIFYFRINDIVFFFSDL